MAEGWKQLVEDLRGALGLPAHVRPDLDGQDQVTPAAERGDETPPSAAARPGSAMPAEVAQEVEPVSADVSELAGDRGAGLVEPVIAPERQVPPETDSEAETAGEVQPPILRQKLSSYMGLAVTLLAALGIGWYVYFGDPRPPAPDVVATFEGGQITVQQARDHLALLHTITDMDVDSFQVS